MCGSRGCRRVLIAAFSTISACILASCGGTSITTPDVTVTPPSTTTPADRVNDGVLRVGVLLPTTGAGARIGTPMTDAVRLAISEVNAAGGVFDQPVDVEFVDEATAIDVSGLSQTGSDVIVGPASSRTAIQFLDGAIESGLLSCSPSATTLLLDRYPDANLFFRTVGSDSMQMAALARTAARTGSGSITIVHLDDPYGRGLANSLQTAVDSRASLSVREVLPFNGDDPELDDDAAAAIASESRIIALLGDVDDGGRMLAALDAVLVANDATRPFIIVNDALRNATDVVAAMSPETRAQIVGVAPRAIVTAVDSPSGYFATNAYDCVILLALAAIQAGVDDPRSIANQVASVSSGGRICLSFSECASLIRQGLQIDYNGLSGSVDLSSTGELTRGWFREFRFDDSGREYIYNETGYEISF